MSQAETNTEQDQDLLFIPHEEFLNGWRAGTVYPEVDRPFAFRLAAQEAGGFSWSLTGWMQLLLTWPVISIALVVLAITLRNGWILLGIPFAFIAPPGMSGYPSYQVPRRVQEPLRSMIRQDIAMSYIHQVFDLVAIGTMFYGFLSLGWKSPVTLVSLSYVLSWAECVVYYAICDRAMTKLLSRSADFYNMAVTRGVVTIKRAG